MESNDQIVTGKSAAIRGRDGLIADRTVPFFPRRTPTTAISLDIGRLNDVPLASFTAAPSFNERSLS